MASRTVCGVLLSEAGIGVADGLAAGIDELTRRRAVGADLLRARLHTVRVLGNKAAHTIDQITEEDALAGLNALLAALRAEGPAAPGQPR